MRNQPKPEEIRSTKRLKLWALSSMLMRTYSGPAPKCFPLRVSTFMLLKNPSQSSLMLSSSHLSHANAAQTKITKKKKLSIQIISVMEIEIDNLRIYIYTGISFCVFLCELAEL